MKNDVLKTEIQDSSLWIYLNRPECLNALNVELTVKLKKVLEEYRENNAIRVVIFRGSGRAFCSGADLKERKGMSEDQAIDFVNLLRKTFYYVYKYPKPTMACINGSAFGGGLELALACDLRVSIESAVIGLTETSLGIIPGAGGTQYLTRILGPAKAKEIIYCASRIEAIDAFHWGLINKLYTKESLDEKTQLLALKIASNAPLAIQAAKKALNAGFRDSMVHGLKLERKAYTGILHTKDRIEGLNAFAEKRAPKFKGE
ncbi:MAG: enoyl-CoA hydratase [Acidobacteria bacterium]|nr:MAG: enoyl-CoA hydratase [Acidobacteriota bacterium]PIE90380.1 MAG: enoyl-CoA hydratase [Acidobacteriota bacterium]